MNEIKVAPLIDEAVTSWPTSDCLGVTEDNTVGVNGQAGKDTGLVPPPFLISFNHVYFVMINLFIGTVFRFYIRGRQRGFY